jgi:poly(3-hydroxybutyrate) depolymerase
MSSYLISGRWHYGVAAAQARWAQLNGCRRRPSTRITRHVDRVSHRACRDDADVVLYRVEGGGHTTPGSVAAIPLRDVLGPARFDPVRLSRAGARGWRAGRTAACAALD